MVGADRENQSAMAIFEVFQGLVISSIRYDPVIVAIFSRFRGDTSALKGTTDIVIGKRTNAD